MQFVGRILPLFVIVIGLTAGCAQGYKITADTTPEQQWAESESRILTNVRQLTSPDMGITESGEAYFAPDMSRIIFQGYPTGQHEYQIYTMELAPDGSPKRETLHQVSPGGGACTCGFFRPDGKKLIYASSFLHPDMANPNFYQREGSSYVWKMPGGTDIFEADLDGSNRRQLTDQVGYDAECGYSPTGNMIVFTSDRGGNPDLYLMDANGGNVHQLTKHPGYDGGPFFSPEGQRIIFRADRHQNDHLQLFVINTDGTGERQLTIDGPTVNWAPYWHPNGHSVVYTTSIHGHYNYEIYLLNIDTGKYQRVTHSPKFDGLAVISPDGKRMMWTSQRGTPPTSQVFIADFKLPDGY